MGGTVKPFFPLEPLIEAIELLTANRVEFEGGRGRFFMCSFTRFIPKASSTAGKSSPPTPTAGKLSTGLDRAGSVGSFGAGLRLVVSLAKVERFQAHGAPHKSRF